MEGGSNKGKVIYPELSYKIVGILFEVYSELGYGYQEKYYQKALERAFSRNNIKFRSQCPYKIKCKEELIGGYFIDFIIEEKIILEIKKGQYYSRKSFEQVMGYLKATSMKLAILAAFTPDGIRFRRTLNLR